MPRPDPFSPEKQREIALEGAAELVLEHLRAAEGFDGIDPQAEYALRLALDNWAKDNLPIQE